MTPRTTTDGRSHDLEGESAPDLTVRDRPYESFGRQGLGLATYNEEPSLHRGAERVDLGEPVARIPGNGPKNWQRRDDRIHDDICAHLTEDGYVDASDLEVIVHRGEVTLSGTTATREQRARAVHIADSARGVIDVVARIRIAKRQP